MIGEALAFGGANSRYCPGFITKTKCLTMIITEVKFREIAVQMLLAAMLIHAAHTALEDGEIAFG